MDLHTVLEDSSERTDQTQVVDITRMAYKEGIDHIIEAPNYVICHIRRAEQQKNFNTWDICNAEGSNVGTNLSDPTKMRLLRTGLDESQTCGRFYGRSKIRRLEKAQKKR
jgi:hypothetical protein